MCLSTKLGTFKFLLQALHDSSILHSQLKRQKHVCVVHVN